MRLSLPLIYLAISYWMVGMNPSFTSFLQFLLAELLSVLAGESIGLVISASVMDFERAMVIATLVSLTFMLTGGFFAENLGDFVKWVQYLSPFYYSYQACIQIEFDHPVACDGSGGLENLCGGRDTGYASAEDVQKLLGAGAHSTAFNCGMLTVIFLVGRYIAYWQLSRHKTGGRQ